jgi:hypothetical protein
MRDGYGKGSVRGQGRRKVQRLGGVEWEARNGRVRLPTEGSEERRRATVLEVSKAESPEQMEVDQQKQSREQNLRQER